MLETAVNIQAWHWVAFNAMVLVFLALDLFVFHKDAHEVSMKEALGFSAFWIGLAVAFNGFVWWWLGQEKALEFATGYLIEKSLSVDNIFVFVMLFTVFGVPALYQHRVLFWGVLGALVMRFILILLGAALLARFHWIIYVFGGFLLLTGVKMLIVSDAEQHPERNPLFQWLKSKLPLVDQYHGQNFAVRIDGKLFFTPLFLVLVLVEFTDLIFAVDSIPAIFAVTKDPFIVYTSNVFAILGLRSLYFALAGLVHKFRYLKTGLAFVLLFVGAKMLLLDIYKVPILASLGIIAGILTVAVLASFVIPSKTATGNAADKEAGHER